MSKSMDFDPLNPLKLRKAQQEELKDDEELLLEQDLEGNKKRQRKVIDTTQYNDDSTDDEYESKEKKNNKTNDDADADADDGLSDMFSSDEEEEAEPEPKKPKLDLLDIDELEKELEIDNSAVINDRDIEEDDLDEEDVGDDDDEEVEMTDDLEYYNNQEETHSINARHEPKLDAFNLKAEQTEGRFDVDGNYIALEESESEDEFAGVKKKDIKRAKRAQLERERQELKKKSQKQDISIEDALEALIGLLKPVESPLEALQRINKSKTKKKNRRKAIITDEEKEKDEERSRLASDITEYSEVLIEKGIQDVYELEREQLMLKYREETGNNYKAKRNSQEPQEAPAPLTESALLKPNSATDVQFNDGKKWEFRWIGDTQIHGPHTTDEIRYWKDNYFQSKAEIRPEGSTTFHHIDSISF